MVLRSEQFSRLTRPGLSNLKIFLRVDDELVQMSTLNYILEVSFEGPRMYGGVPPIVMKGTTSCFQEVRVVLDCLKKFHP